LGGVNELVPKPKALDLFCGVGGATRGLQLAGFHVTGVDIEPQPRYCGDEFIQGDALTVPLQGFDLIWSGPPCQAYTRAHFTSKREHPRLIVPTRHRLEDSGALYVIENVPGAPLRDPQRLCGSSFGLKVSIGGTWYELRRHRDFESNFFFLAPQCQHRLPVVGIYGNGESLPVPGKRGFQVSTEAHQREVMQMPWANRGEISEAIPPAYSELIGRAAMSALGF
jgi:DNA (cytosine-5)-methyltransferase 1